MGSFLKVMLQSSFQTNGDDIFQLGALSEPWMHIAEWWWQRSCLLESPLLLQKWEERVKVRRKHFEDGEWSKKGEEKHEIS